MIVLLNWLDDESMCESNYLHRVQQIPLLLGGGVYCIAALSLVLHIASSQTRMFCAHTGGFSSKCGREVSTASLEVQLAKIEDPSQSRP